MKKYIKKKQKDTKVEIPKEYIDLGKITKSVGGTVTATKQKQKIGAGRAIGFLDLAGKISGTGKVTQEFQTYFTIKVSNGKAEVGGKVVAEK